MERNIRDIWTLIEDAFAGVQRDEDCTLHQGQFRDTFGDFDITEAEWNLLYDAEKTRDPETDWRDVPASAIDECDCAQSHLNPQGWHFYLPAYMRRALELIDTDLWLPDSVVFHLTYRKDSGAYDPGQGPANSSNSAAGTASLGTFVQLQTLMRRWESEGVKLLPPELPDAASSCSEYRKGYR